MKFLLATVVAALASFTVTASPMVEPAIQETVTETVVTLPGGWPPPPPTKTTTKKTTTTTTTSTTTTSSFIITITTLPGKPTTTSAVTPRPCPTVTITTRPAGCEPIRCPIPGCTYEEDMIIPCGCTPRTLLWVEGCQTACPEGCATRTNTLSQLCGTASLALPTAA